MSSEQRPKNTRQNDEDEKPKKGSSSKGVPSFDSIVQYAQTHTKDTIAFVLLILGIFWMLINPFYGGLLIGLIMGFYFSKEIVYLIKNYNEFVEHQGIARSIILAGIALTLFITAPGIFIGAALMAGLKVLMKSTD